MTDQRQGNRGNGFNREPAENTMLARVDTDRMASMVASGSHNSLRTNFLPTSFHEALELAKLMAAGTLIPARFHNKPGDCLAVVMQATRWGMDPFAVAQKVYFVNSGGVPGYEAQLVAAVINTSGVLEGRLIPTWTGEGEAMKCTVTGRLKGETAPVSIEVELRTITTRNSPLWKQQPKIQLGYYTQRAWARLFAPEVMLGVYAAEDLVEDGATARSDEARPVAPSRASIADRQRQEQQPARVIDNGESVDTTTGEVDREPQESEEEIARRLDAEQAAAERGEVDNPEDEVAETIDEVAAAKVETTPTVGPHDGALPPEEKPQTIDWEAWLGKFDKDLAALTTAEAIEQLYASKGERLTNAPDGVKNRARGYRDAALRKLPAPQEEKPAARRRAAAAAKIEEQAEAVTQADPPAEEPATDVDPRTGKADAIIADLNKKEMLVDLRSAKAGYDADIDAMDEDNAGRVIRAYRAIEDRLTGKRK